MVDPTPPCPFPVLILSLGLLLGVMNLQRRRGGPDLMEEGGAAALHRDEDQKTYT